MSHTHTPKANVRNWRLQAYLRDAVDLVPDHCNAASCNPFAGGGSCFQFVKYTTSVKFNTMRYACT